MGVFALIRGLETQEYQRSLLQTGAAMVKVPLLFLMTLIVTFPSLYVFNALVGSQLRLMAVLKLLVASLAVNLAVLASMGPIVAFFSACTPNYSFIVLLNVVVFALAGCLGLVFLVQTLNRLTEAQRGNLPPGTLPVSQTTLQPAEAIPASEVNVATETSASELAPAVLARPAPDASAGPLDRLQGVSVSSNVKKVFSIWIIVFGLVGAQMSWVLRPFIGSPNEPFEFFRERNSNFFEAVWQLFVQFMNGG